ncbi:hypothetical protein [Aquibacillus sediminis]|uniref:hypothetical protein n=1 Tax=Aquibacillus sediminis TaxID=2574734 RepID=UPI001109A261|nr:hypothetical protein [Aquibacillus sediminis]
MWSISGGHLAKYRNEDPHQGCAPVRGSVISQILPLKEEESVPVDLCQESGHQNNEKLFNIGRAETFLNFLRS